MAAVKRDIREPLVPVGGEVIRPRCQGTSAHPGVVDSGLPRQSHLDGTYGLPLTTTTTCHTCVGARSGREPDGFCGSFLASRMAVPKDAARKVARLLPSGPRSPLKDATTDSSLEHTAVQRYSGCSPVPRSPAVAFARSSTRMRLVTLTRTDRPPSLPSRWSVREKRALSHDQLGRRDIVGTLPPLRGRRWSSRAEANGDPARLTAACWWPSSQGRSASRPVAQGDLPRRPSAAPFSLCRRGLSPAGPTEWWPRGGVAATGLSRRPPCHRHVERTGP
jgi:hypothetical protein